MNSPAQRNAKPDVVSVQPALQSVSESLDAIPLDDDTDFVPFAPKVPVWRKVIFPTAFMLVVLISLLTMLDLAGHSSSKAPTETDLTNTSANLKAQSTPLTALGKQLERPLPSAPNTLTVNGQLAVNNSLILTPGSKPSNPVTGQIYYNQSINRPEYYDGKQFVILQSVAGATTVNNNVSNVTNITNVSNGGGSTVPIGLVTSSTGSPGDLAMFATDNTLGDSLITENGTTLTVGGVNVNVGTGGASEMVNLGSIAGNSGTVIQAGTGGTSLVTGPSNGASGEVTITSGNSSTTSAGNVDIDTGSSVVNGEVIGDLGFEDNTTDNIDDWFGSSLVPTTTEAHTGTHSLEVTETGNFWGIIQNGNVSLFPVTAGHHTLFSLWVRAATTPRQINATIAFVNYGTFALTSETDTTSGWTEIQGLATIPAGVSEAYFEATGNGGVNGEVQYFDDFEVTDLTSNPTSAVLNLGATNAQEVNIGNLDELNATTIDGGGITLDAGAGTLNETGGVFNISGSASSDIVTSAGALTLTSAASATWGIGDASGGAGGNLTIDAGNGNGATNGGNLILEGGQTGTGTGGSVIAQPQTDNTAAFQVQNAGGTDTVLNVDTSNLIVTVAGTAANFATLAINNAHLSSTQTAAPTVTGISNCGSGGTANVTAGSTDTAGSLTINSGSGSPSSCDTTIKFNSAYTTTPKTVILTPTLALGGSVAPTAEAESADTNSFTVEVAPTNASPSATYGYYYLVIQ